jgi:hypothetical protein
MRSIWERCYDLKNTFAKKIGEKMAFLLKLLLVWGKMIITLFFGEKRQFFFRRKLAKIVEKCDHNIDPWPPWSKQTPALKAISNSEPCIS